VAMAVTVIVVMVIGLGLMRVRPAVRMRVGQAASVAMKITMERLVCNRGLHSQ
jgi:hypothetical protein